MAKLHPIESEPLLSEDGAALVVSGRTEVQPLTFIKSFHEVRPINPAYLEHLRAKVRRIGVKPYPLSVTPDGKLFGGRHRYEAFLAEGINECLMHIYQPDSLDRESIELNEASEDALPMSFVDYAERVWARLDAGETQQAVADDLGWSREKVKDLAALQKIAPEAWRAIGATLNNFSLVPENGSAPTNGATAPFTERLLRSIIPLTPEQQLELVQWLSRGKNNKGHAFGKSDFKDRAERYRALNDLVESARESLSSRVSGAKLDEYVADAERQLQERAYVDEKLAGGSARFDKLIQSYVDAFEEAMNCRVLTKDIRDISALDIPDASVDAIVTDPPYPREYVDLFDDLGALAARVLKPGGSLVVLCGQSYLPQYMELLSRHMDYQWMIGVHMPGGQAVQLHQREVTAFWKPALWFTKGPRDGKWVSDFIRTDVNNNDKQHHHWGQSEQIMTELVDRVTLTGDVVLDPFLGGGTTGVVCRKMKRKFIGVEVDPEVSASALARIGGAQ